MIHLYYSLLTKYYSQYSTVVTLLLYNSVHTYKQCIHRSHVSLVIIPHPSLWLPSLKTTRSHVSHCSVVYVVRYQSFHGMLVGKGILRGEYRWTSIFLAWFNSTSHRIQWPLLCHGEAVVVWRSVKKGDNIPLIIEFYARQEEEGNPYMYWIDEVEQYWKVRQKVRDITGHLLYVFIVY